ncbi:MAG: DMT family transporter [Chlamydiota bacterium]
MELHFFHYRQLKKGIVLFLLAYLFIAITYTFSQVASRTASVSEMVFFRNLVGLLLALPWMLKNSPDSFKVARIGILTMRSALGMLGIVCVFIAVRKVTLVNVTLLSNTAPLFVPFIGWIFLKKPIDHKGWLPLILGFIGIALILSPSKGVFDPYAFYALGNGLTTAATFLVVRMATKTEKMHTMLFYYYLIGFLLFLPINLFTMTMPSWTSLFELVMIGVFAYCGSALSFSALQYAKASQLAPFSYSGVVFAAFIQWLLWGELPTVIHLLGLLITCAAGIYILLISKPPATQ